MTRTIQVHPLSVLIGIAISACLAFLVSATTQAPTVSPGALQARQVTSVPLVITSPVKVAGIPAPAQMVRLTSADLPYTVPQNRALVIKTIGTTASVSWVYGTVKIDGQVVLAVGLEPLAGMYGQGSLEVVEPGILAKAGSLVECSFAQGPAYSPVLFGYLADV